MLFSEKYKNSTEGCIQFRETTIKKKGEPSDCVYCRRETNFVDLHFNLAVCSEECDDAVWTAYRKDMEDAFFFNHLQRYGKEMRQELSVLDLAPDATKDILIVVHDQLEYLKITLESVIAHTSNYRIYLWDNASGPDVTEYLKEVGEVLGDRLVVVRSEENRGFIRPNDELIAMGTGDYVILLNSDVKVLGGWDKGLIGYLDTNPDTKIVGYSGGLLDADGIGGRIAFGDEVDYIPGWCLCLSRKTYEEFGLFHEEMDFAYSEDSELCIRIQKSGYKIHALHLMLVYHYENKTIGEVRKKRDCSVTFQLNHQTLRRLHSDYLANQRVDVRTKASESSDP